MYHCEVPTHRDSFPSLDESSFSKIAYIKNKMHDRMTIDWKWKVLVNSFQLISTKSRHNRSTYIKSFTRETLKYYKVVSSLIILTTRYIKLFELYSDIAIDAV